MHLLSRCHVACAGRLLHHDGTREGIVCLELRMSEGISPLTTGSMKVGVDWMHPDTSRRMLLIAASCRCVWALRHHTGRHHDNII